MPGTFVSSRSLTGTKPRRSVSTPAAARLRRSVLGTRPAATSRCEPASVGLPVRRLDGQLDAAVRAWRHPHRPGFQQHLHAVLAQDVAHRVGHVGVLAGEQLPAPLHDRHLAAKAAEHLAELQPDVAPADHQQVARAPRPAP